MAEKHGKSPKGSEPKKSDNARIVKKTNPASVPKKSGSPTIKKNANIKLEESRASRQMASDGGDLRKPKPTVAKPDKNDD